MQRSASDFELAEAPAQASTVRARPVAIRLDGLGMPTLVSDAVPERAGVVTTIRPGATDQENWEPVTTELAQEAQALQPFFDLRATRRPWTAMHQAMGLTEPLEGAPPHLRASSQDWADAVCPEVARALGPRRRLCASVDPVHQVRRKRRLALEQQARRDPRAPNNADPWKPKSILMMLILETLYLGLRLPPYVDERVVEWVCEHLGIRRPAEEGSPRSWQRRRCASSSPTPRS